MDSRGRSHTLAMGIVQSAEQHDAPHEPYASQQATYQIKSCCQSQEEDVPASTTRPMHQHIDFMMFVILLLLLLCIARHISGSLHDVRVTVHGRPSMQNCKIVGCMNDGRCLVVLLIDARNAYESLHPAILRIVRSLYQHS